MASPPKGLSPIVASPPSIPTPLSPPHDAAVTAAEAPKQNNATRTRIFMTHDTANRLPTGFPEDPLGRWPLCCPNYVLVVSRVTTYFKDHLS